MQHPGSPTSRDILAAITALNNIKRKANSVETLLRRSSRPSTPGPRNVTNARATSYPNGGQRPTYETWYETPRRVPQMSNAQYRLFKAKLRARHYGETAARPFQTAGFLMTLPFRRRK